VSNHTFSKNVCLVQIRAIAHESHAINLLKPSGNFTYHQV
jgi:hypothetical protein